MRSHLRIFGIALCLEECRGEWLAQLALALADSPVQVQPPSTRKSAHHGQPFHPIVDGANDAGSSRWTYPVTPNETVLYDSPYTGQSRALVAAFLSWVDYSSAERQRMRQAVALFAEKDTRDELGLGGIRDAISDALFPGTSVIQTRLRYLLFVPWIYQTLEKNKRVHAANVERWARGEEIALIEPLVHAADAEGVIGRRARGALQRLPSSVYWLALGRWGVLEQRWSTDDYHRSWDRMRRAERSERGADDHGVRLDRVTTWNVHLPPPPPDFPAGLTFELTRREAEFVQERIRENCHGTLLAHAVDADEQARPHLDAGAPWESFARALPSELAAQLDLARKFAVLMQGAVYTYNLALARRADAFANTATQHATSLLEWAEDAAGQGVMGWSLDELWSFCSGRANVTLRTREFVTTWQRLFREHGRGVGDTAEATRLVEQRERQLKGSRSRFCNSRALEVWGGDSGTALMTYRWRTVRRLLADLYQGLAQTEA